MLLYVLWLGLLSKSQGKIMEEWTKHKIYVGHGWKLLLFAFSFCYEVLYLEMELRVRVIFWSCVGNCIAHESLFIGLIYVFTLLWNRERLKVEKRDSFSQIWVWVEVLFSGNFFPCLLPEPNGFEILVFLNTSANVFFPNLGVGVLASSAKWWPGLD